MVWYRFGKGQVIWWAIASPMSNGSILDQGNLALFLNSVGPPTSRILWDEYFHGVRRSLSSYFAADPACRGPDCRLPSSSQRCSSRSRVDRDRSRCQLGESRLSPLEFVDTLGDLYQSAQAAQAAVDVAYQRLRLSLVRKLGISAQIKLPELCQVAAARLGWPADALFQTLAASERATRDIHLDSREALDLVRELHEYADRLEHQQSPAQEKSAWK